MWVSKKKWEALEKRVADLEGKAQSQQKELLASLKCINSRPIVLSCQGNGGGGLNDFMNYSGGKG